jgi:superfamily II DNA or RNA helicase
LSPVKPSHDGPSQSASRGREGAVARVAQLERDLAENQRLQARLTQQLKEARGELARLDTPSRPAKAQHAGAPEKLSPEKKVALFRSVFRGREDVYPTRFVSKKTGKAGYSPVCANKFVEGLCELPKIKCAACPNRAFCSVDDEAVLAHLDGRHVMGVYPLLPDETCWFLAMDFDEESWAADANAVRETSERMGIPAYVERSRSGNGAHVWFFFSRALSAGIARKLGSHVLTETMSSHPGLSFKSYDRLFPNQDTMPAGGLGNLIALPLQFEPRKQGNSVFVDADWKPVPSQWALLRRIQRLEPDRIEAIVRKASREGTVLGVRSVGEESDDGDAPWLRSPSGAAPTRAIAGPLPEKTHATLAQRLFVDKEGLPPALVAQVRRIAAFQNPEFYKKQAMRMSIWDTPRIICCAENLDRHVALPRGSVPDLRALAERHGINLALEDLRIEGDSIDVRFHGELTPLQSQALEAIAAHDTGVFVAPPGVGKTVVAIALIAHRKRSTLVLVNRRHLLEQWRGQLALFLGIDQAEIGLILGGKSKKSKRTGRLDVAMVQSLVKPDSIDDLVAEYGQVIVDECHHASSVSFERMLAEVRARYVVGLTATPQRRDGHQAVMRMQLGPIRVEVNPRSLAASRPFEHKLIVRDTLFRLEATDIEPTIMQIYARLAADEPRNAAILEDVIGTLAEGRHPVVLTQRREHVDWFAQRLAPYARTVAVLKGGMGKRAEKQVRDSLAGGRANGSTVLVATGPYIGEGFDDVHLDTLFLAMPIAWKGTLAQYVGRLHRLHPGKKEVRVFDYVDKAVPTLASMFGKRLRSYRSIGYQESELPAQFELLAEEWPGDWDDLDDEDEVEGDESGKA